jgi:hypothetical protein
MLPYRLLSAGKVDDGMSPDTKRSKCNVAPRQNSLGLALFLWGEQPRTSREVLVYA